LPKDRVQDGPPFSITGVDFTGALNIRNKDGSTCKTYICLFTCAKTRAVHLEIVQDMTIESFMLAFRRFISRKSTPTVMMSDNALTYTAAAKLLKDPSTLSEHDITWKFIPQHAPWYGGWWERLIGLTKTCIKRVLGKALVSLEVLQTLITEVECIINDRPLTYVSSDHLDEDPLTPSHLIYGRRITSPVFPEDMCETTPTSLSQNSVKKLANFTATTIQHFWTRWKNEYLTSLREYHKLHQRLPDTPKIGDVVLIHDDNIHRTRWPLAVVDELITGTDGFARAARVRTSRGVTIRPIKKLYPLEINE
jgi:hypothetical protein